MTGSIAKAYTAIGGLHCNCLNSLWTALTITPTTSWPGRISVLRRFRKIKQILPCVWIELWQIKKLWKLIQIWQKPIIWSVSCRFSQIWPQATKTLVEGFAPPAQAGTPGSREEVQNPGVRTRVSSKSLTPHHAKCARPDLPPTLHHLSACVRQGHQFSMCCAQAWTRVLSYCPVLYGIA